MRSPRGARQAGSRQPATSSPWTDSSTRQPRGSPGGQPLTRKTCTRHLRLARLNPSQPWVDIWSRGWPSRHRERPSPPTARQLLACPGSSLEAHQEARDNPARSKSIHRPKLVRRESGTSGRFRRLRRGWGQLRAVVATPGPSRRCMVDHGRFLAHLLCHCRLREWPLVRHLRFQERAHHLAGNPRCALPAGVARPTPSSLDRLSIHVDHHSDRLARRDACRHCRRLCAPLRHGRHGPPLPRTPRSPGRPRAGRGRRTMGRRCLAMASRRCVGGCAHDLGSSGRLQATLESVRMDPRRGDRIPAVVPVGLGSVVGPDSQDIEDPQCGSRRCPCPRPHRRSSVGQSGRNPESHHRSTEQHNPQPRDTVGAPCPPIGQWTRGGWTGPTGGGDRRVQLRLDPLQA